MSFNHCSASKWMLFSRGSMTFTALGVSAQCATKPLYRRNCKEQSLEEINSHPGVPARERRWLRSLMIAFVSMLLGCAAAYVVLARRMDTPAGSLKVELQSERERVSRLFEKDQALVMSRVFLRNLTEENYRAARLSIGITPGSVFWKDNSNAGEPLQARLADYLKKKAPSAIRVRSFGIEFAKSVEPAVVTVHGTVSTDDGKVFIYDLRVEIVSPVGDFESVGPYITDFRLSEGGLGFTSLLKEP